MGGEIGFIEKAKGFIGSPTETFRKVKEENLTPALKYLVIWIIFYGVLASLIYVLVTAPMFKMFGKMEALFGWATGAVLIVIMIIMIIIFGIIGTLLGGAWLHLWVYLMGGKNGYHQTVKAIIYGDTPSFIFGWIPFIGIIAAIWSLVLLIFGLKELQDISIGRAVIAIILAVIIPVIILSVFMASFIFWWVSGAG